MEGVIQLIYSILYYPLSFSNSTLQQGELLLQKLLLVLFLLTCLRRFTQKYTFKNIHVWLDTCWGQKHYINTQYTTAERLMQPIYLSYGAHGGENMTDVSIIHPLPQEFQFYVTSATTRLVLNRLNWPNEVSFSCVGAVQRRESWFKISIRLCKPTFNIFQ